MTKEFWKNKRVFLTGHTGFKGSWLSLWLQSLGANVTGYSLNPPTSPSLFELSNCKNGMVSIIGDIRDYNSLSKAIVDSNPEIVFHLAAQPLVLDSYKNPIETYSTNVMGVVNLFESVRTFGKNVKVVINVTTDKCYENKEWVWSYRENEPMGGYDPYSSSKGCSELVTSAFRNSFFNPANFGIHGVAVSSARAGNVIGGGDWAANRLIPDIINSILEGESVKIRYPKAIRPWQHVLEPLSGYMCLAEKMYENGTSFSESWNFGPRENDAKPVEWIVEKLTRKWGNGASWKLDSDPQLHEANYLKLDISKAISKLGWEPKWTISETISHIIEWYKVFQEGGDIREITINQIKLFEKS